MKSLFFLTAFALADLTISVSETREGNLDQDCIEFANDQDENFYEGPFLEYQYLPCNDPEEIIASVSPDLQCIPLIGETPELTDQTCEAGEYKHYHWTIQDYDVINDPSGSSIEFFLTPCDGHPELYIKPQILYAGIPMCQLFETVPNSDGQRTNTWPFPNNLTGSEDQGPDKALFELEKQAKQDQGTDLQYPGSFFSTQKWGHNGSITSDDGRPQPHQIRIPSISYGGFFISVYCKTASVFEVGLVAQHKTDADTKRHADKDEDSLAMKIRRMGYEIDDAKIDENWGDLDENVPTFDFLNNLNYNCDVDAGDYDSCAKTFYVTKFGLGFPDEDTLLPAEHPESEASTWATRRGINYTDIYCYSFSAAECEEQYCCKWSEENDRDIADFIKYGPFALREFIERDEGICRPATTKQSLCVTKKFQEDMTTDNRVCEDDEDLDQGGCDRGIQATMEVSFYTGEAGGDSEEDWPMFQLNYVEMNDCASQKDKVGHDFCWEADYDRSIEEYGEDIAHPAGEDGFDWGYTCGEGSGDKLCDPTFQERGKCFWDGRLDLSKPNETTRETQWSQNADDCIMWTPCGVMKNGMPVMIEHKKGTVELIKREIPAHVTRHDKDHQFPVEGSYYIYGHVSHITRESMESTTTNVLYNREVFEEEKTWLRFPPRTWVRVEVPVFNEVTYFFNVLRNVSNDDGEWRVESYNGVSAVTSFYHKTQLFSDTTIIIIALVVVVALLFLLIPFIYTKNKIKAHLRKVYEAHKQRGKGRDKEGEGEAVHGDKVVALEESDKGSTVVGFTPEKQHPKKEQPGKDGTVQ